MKRVLIADTLSRGWQSVFAEAPDVDVDVRTGLSPEALAREIGAYDGMIIRSETHVTREILAAAHRLRVIGRAGVGVDNIDIGAATERGVVVVHSPGGNTIATAEHTVGMLLALSRNIPQATASLKRGAWERKSYTGVELNGKVLGIIGVGRVGQHVARLARALGMTALGHDPFLSEEMAARYQVKLMSLEAIYAAADYITLHTPLMENTRHLISAASLEKCKPGVRILNCARGGLVDEAALLNAIEDGNDFAFVWSYAEMAPLVTGVGYDWAIEKTAKCIGELNRHGPPGRRSRRARPPGCRRGADATRSAARHHHVQVGRQPRPHRRRLG